MEDILDKHLSDFALVSRGDDKRRFFNCEQRIEMITPNYEESKPDAGSLPERRITLIHRVLVPDAEYPKEYAILVTDRRSIFIRQPKTRSNFWLRGEMKWGTALVTDVVPKTLEDYEKMSFEELTKEPLNFVIPHESVISLVKGADKPTFRRTEFWVKWTMQGQKEIFQVYNFEIVYRRSSGGRGQLKFFAVPLGSYFKPRRQTQTREIVLREYADSILEIFRQVLLARVIEVVRRSSA